MEDQIRRIVREEITRALGAVGAVATEVYNDAPMDSPQEDAADMLRRTMERVARDVLANKHPVLSTEHASTDVVHVVTDARTVPSTVCTVCEHAAHRGVCGSVEWPATAPCECSGVRCLTFSEAEHAGSHTDETMCTWCEHAAHGGHIGHRCSCGCTGPSTQACTVCLHPPHKYGRCLETAYSRGLPSACQCKARGQL